MERTAVVLSVLLVISFKNGFGQDITCAQGRDEKWIYNDGFCYFIYEEESYVSWYKALDFCQKMKANLVSVQNASEAEFLKMKVMDNAKKESQMWIGLQRSQNKSFSWSDGNEVTYENWGVNQSSDMANNKSCVYINSDNGLWKTADCNTKLQFICKKERDSTVTTQLNNVTVNNVKNYCPSEWSYFGKKCYKIFGSGDQKKWQEAENNCLNQYANYSTIISISNKEEQEYVTNLLKDYSFDVWIGLRNDNNVQELNGSYSVDLHSNVSLNNETFQSRGECAAMRFSLREEELFINDDCESKKGYICEMPSSENLSEFLYGHADKLVGGPKNTSNTGTMNAGTMIFIIMGSILCLFVVSTIGYIVYKKSITGQRRLFIIRNRVFNHRRMDLQTLI